MTGIPASCFDEVQLTPAIGKRIVPDGWGNLGNTAGSQLIACDDWDKAEYRLPSPYWNYETAVNIEVTGRTIQTIGGCYGIRVKITFVGDYEPDVIVRGWMEV